MDLSVCLIWKQVNFSFCGHLLVRHQISTFVFKILFCCLVKQHLNCFVSGQSGYTMEGVIAPSMQRVLVSPTTNIGLTLCPFVLWPSIIPFGPENQGRWLLSHMSLNVKIWVLFLFASRSYFWEIFYYFVKDAAFPCTNWTITLQSWDRNALVSAVNIATGFFPFTTVNGINWLVYQRIIL